MRYLQYCIFFFLLACGQSSDRKPDRSQAPDSKHTIALVICDVSGSVTREKKQHQQRVLQYVKDIPAHLQKPYVAHYIVATDNMHQPCITNAPLNALPLAQHKRMQEDELNDLRMMKITQTIDSLFEVYEKGQTSCLLTSIYRAHEMLRSFANGDSSVPLKLIILSDMLEDCAQSLDGNMIMVADSAASMQDIEKRIQKMEMPFSMAGLNINIVVLNTSPGTNVSSYQRLNKAWGQLFLKMGCAPSQVKYVSQLTRDAML